MAFFLEILKLTIPGLLVFLAVYLTLRNYLEHQRQLRYADIQQSRQKDILPLKLQAYERLTLLCERIAIPNLVLRLRDSEMSAAELRVALLLGIQQEFEHNLSQQVYISDQLWQILKIARDNTVGIIQEVASTIPANADAKELSKALFEYLNTHPSDSLDKALTAIRHEAGAFMKGTV